MCLDPKEQKLCASEPTRHEPSAGERMVSRGGVHDWHEQIVGSAHSALVELPEFSSSPTWIVAKVSEGTDAFEMDPYAVGAQVGRPIELAPPPPISVRFAPRHPGGFVGVLTITACWSDGHMATRHVSLFGRARAVDALPPGAAMREWGEPVAAPEIDPTSEEAHIPMNAGLLSATDLARSEADRFGSNLALGVRDVEKLSALFVPRPDRRSLWEAMAKEAIMLGIEILVPKIATNVVGKLANAVAEDMHVATRLLVQKHSHGFPVLAPGPLKGALVKQTETIASSTPVADLASHDIVKGLGKGLEKGLKGIGKAAIEGAVAEKRGAPDAAVIKFFSSQEAATISLAAQTSRMLAMTQYALVPVQAKNLPLAVGAMRAFEESLTLAADDAQRTQQQFTSQAWLSFKAQNELGSEALADGRSVTDMTGARAWTDHGLVAPSLKDGVLELAVSVAEGHPKVTGARLLGISKEIANAFETIDLRTAAIPMRINIENAAFITRDETGRIRVSGALHLVDTEARPADTRGEAQAIRGAERMVEAVLSVSLSKQKLHIETNDARDAEPVRKS